MLTERQKRLLRQIPKAENHIHIEGSIPWDLALQLAERNHVEMPYKNIGCIPAKLDDVFNYIPARLSGLVMLLAGGILRLNFKNGWKIFKRDRYNHASPNSAQTESVCAGLLGLRLAGDAYYHGVLHKKPYIGDPIREIEYEDIPRACRLLYGTAMVSLVLFCGIKLLLLLVI